jgi:hypothetical protein
MSTLRKKKVTKVTGNDRRSDSPTGNFWTQLIAPRGAALLSETLQPCHFVVKNCGRNNVFLVAENGDLMELNPGDVRATYASGTIRVENWGERSALIEFQFLPLLLKH